MAISLHPVGAVSFLSESAGVAWQAYTQEKHYIKMHKLA
jgi:hypothetical protein